MKSVRGVKVCDGHYDTFNMQAFDAHEIADLLTLTEPGTENNALQMETWMDRMIENGREWAGLGYVTPYTGEACLAEARRLVMHGWPEGMERFQREAGEMQVNLPATRSIRRRGSWAAQGDDLSMERVYGGDLDHAWRRTVRAEGEGSAYVTLTLSWGGNCGHGAKNFFWPGAVLVALADALEESGRRVTIQVAYQVASGLTMLKLKQAQEPLRMDELLAVVCHPGVYRAMGIGSAAVSATNIGEGMGRAQSPTDDALQAAAAEGLIEEPGILVRGVEAGVTTAHAAMAEIQRILAIVDPGATSAY